MIHRQQSGLKQRVGVHYHTPFTLTSVFPTDVESFVVTSLQPGSGHQYPTELGSSRVSPQLPSVCVSGCSNPPSPEMRVPWEV